jgi:hypothetical protein
VQRTSSRAGIAPAEVRSELQFQGELDLAGRAEVSGGETGVADDSESGAAGYEGEVGIAEVRLVEDVEELGAELEVHALGEFGVFDDGEIGVQESRAGNGVASEIAEVASGCVGGIGAGNGKGIDVAEPVARPAGGGNGADQVGTKGAEAGGSGELGDGGDDIERIAGLDLGHQAELPAIEQARLVKRELIEAADDETVPDIEVGESAVVADGLAGRHSRQRDLCGRAVCSSGSGSPGSRRCRSSRRSGLAAVEQRAISLVIDRACHPHLRHHALGFTSLGLLAVRVTCVGCRAISSP